MKTDTYLKWDEVWFLSGRHSATSPGMATAWCAPRLVALSLCALWFWPSELLLPFSKPSWHTAFQHRDHLFYGLEILFHKLKMKKELKELQCYAGSTVIYWQLEVTMHKKKTLFEWKSSLNAVSNRSLIDFFNFMPNILLGLTPNICISNHCCQSYAFGLLLLFSPQYF